MDRLRFVRTEVAKKRAFVKVEEFTVDAYLGAGECLFISRFVVVVGATVESICTRTHKLL